MLRAISHLPAGHEQGAAFERVVLAHDERRLRRRLLTLPGGTEVLVDFPQATTLEDGGALVLEDGRLVEIAAAEEDVFAVTAADPAHLLRLAWHIGNRHTPAQLEDGRILIKRDHVLKAMLEGLGAEVSEVRGPFSPEHGAYHSHGPGGEPGHALTYRK